MPSLLAQRAVADDPRWTRAVEGSLGRPPQYRKGEESRGNQVLSYAR